MLARHRSGHAADALAAYQEARRILADELGAEPETRLRQLHDQILRRAARRAVRAARCVPHARLPRHRLSSSRYSLAWLPAVPSHGARLNGGYRSVTRTNA
jgi:DNA-binding SARP family transcriptional activator